MIRNFLLNVFGYRLSKGTMRTENVKTAFLQCSNCRMVYQHNKFITNIYHNFVLLKFLHFVVPTYA